MANKMNSQIKPMIGLKFGKLTVLELLPERRGANKALIYRCACECGNETITTGTNLRSGTTNSCGCLRITKFVGQVFGKLTVIERLVKGGINSRVKYKCKCECGEEVEISHRRLISGKVNSCGCDKKSRLVLDGHLHIKPMIGLKFGELTVIEMLPKMGSNGRSYICKCDCGEEKVFRGYELRNGMRKTCGHNRSLTIKNREEYLYKKMYNNYIVRRCKYSNFEYNITLDEYIQLIHQPCHYCGIENSNMSKDQYRGIKMSDTVISYNGLDRIDSKIGYMKDNVVTSCVFCNQAKNNLSYKDFKDWIERVYNYSVKNKQEV